MVKILPGKTLDDTFTEDECETAVQITRRLAGPIPQITPYTRFEFSVGTSVVNMRTLQIMVRDEPSLQRAIAITKSYESEFKDRLKGEEFTIVKNYD